ncbi:hypothetical protein PVAG01_01311 [Phlyctema vagabunda]|uniref:Uncharacterized protein n=1 Tax=Phlyctema vagabunda TaxID=108571 RepID=A0ABR4PWR7_9HELO
MQNSRFSTISSRFSSFRRSSSASSSSQHSVCSASNRHSFMSSSSSSTSSSPVLTINEIMHRQPAMLHREEERKSFGTGLEIMEPRPIVYWGGLEERMASL